MAIQIGGSCCGRAMLRPVNQRHARSMSCRRAPTLECAPELPSMWMRALEPERQGLQAIQKAAAVPPKKIPAHRLAEPPHTRVRLIKRTTGGKDAHTHS